MTRPLKPSNSSRTRHKPSNYTARSATQISVSQARAGQRLDNFLMAHFRLLPKSYIYRIVRKGEVRINSKRAQPSSRLQANDKVRIPPLKIKNRTLANISPQLASQLNQHILFEDDQLIVINKPAGLSVHSGSGHNYGLIELLKVDRPSADIALAHRLDKDVSGCLLVSKTRKTLLYLHHLMRQHEIEKTYRALVVGKWKKPQTVNLELSHSGQKQTVTKHGKQSVSHFEPLEHFGDYTLVAVRIPTGRTHQIRVHASASMYPIVGDRKYGNFKINRLFRKHGLQRIFLHAFQLSFSWNDKPRTFTADLPADLKDLLNTIDF